MYIHEVLSNILILTFNSFIMHLEYHYKSPKNLEEKEYSE